MVDVESIIKELLDLGFTITTGTNPPRVHYNLYHSNHSTTKLPVITVYGSVQLKQLLNTIRLIQPMKPTYYDVMKREDS